MVATSTTTAPANGTLLQLSPVEDTWHTGGAATLGSTAAVEDEGSLASGMVERREMVEASSPSDGSAHAASRPPSITVSRDVGRLEGDTGVLAASSTTTTTTITTATTTTATTTSSTSNTMHTEEEDVATFLATQLASQAAPSNSNSECRGVVMNTIDIIFLS